MALYFVRQDIVQMPVDAIVNAANEGLLQGGGVCGAIFRAAGAAELTAECRQKAPCPTGQAVVTGGYRLPARYVIHAVGPVWRGGASGERKLLQSAYRNALELARQQGCESIAFPLISSGIYGYPKQEALRAAVEAIRAFLAEQEMEVYLTLFGPAPVVVPEELAAQVAWLEAEPPVSVLADEGALLCEASRGPEMEFLQERALLAPMAPVAAKRSLADLLGNLDETFSEMLLRLIDEKSYTDVEVYKRANLDRKLFSKIRGNREYVPKKQTVLALAVGLRLSEDEAKDLLMRAGYSFSGSRKQDVILRYYIKEKIYDIDRINETLFFYGEPLLGSR